MEAWKQEKKRYCPAKIAACEQCQDRKLVVIRPERFTRPTAWLYSGLIISWHKYRVMSIYLKVMEAKWKKHYNALVMYEILINT